MVLNGSRKQQKRKLCLLDHFFPVRVSTVPFPPRMRPIDDPYSTNEGVWWTPEGKALIMRQDPISWKTSKKSERFIKIWPRPACALNIKGQWLRTNEKHWPYFSTYFVARKNSSQSPRRSVIWQWGSLVEFSLRSSSTCYVGNENFVDLVSKINILCCGLVIRTVEIVRNLLIFSC